MNERILKLAEGAGLGRERWNSTEQFHVFLERFAVLIVQRCIQVGGPEDSYTDEWFKAKVNSVAKIKQHFGVE
jgi:hypothetical protein